MATYKDIYNQSLTRVSEDTTSPDSEGLTVIKNAINEGYLILRTTIDKRNKTIDYEVDLTIDLPTDLLYLNDVTHDSLGKLSSSTYEVNNNQLDMLSKDIDSGTLTLNYSFIPDKLVGDNDVLVLKTHLEAPLAAFGAYAYMLYKKKYNAAQMLQQEFMMFIQTKEEIPQ